ncbi:hypothetical protein FD733_02195 [Pantoea sp. Eser]|nr:hypothetical protein [Pantoea sp. Eser]
MTVKITTLIQVTDGQVGIHLEIDEAEMADLAEGGIAQILLSRFAVVAQNLKSELDDSGDGD